MAFELPNQNTCETNHCEVNSSVVFIPFFIIFDGGSFYKIQRYKRINVTRNSYR